MVTIGMDYYVLEGKEAVFESAFARVLDAIRAAEGHDDSHLYREVGNGAAPRYLIVSRWSDEEAFERFIGSDAFRKVASWGKENILSQRPSHTTYRSE